MSSAWVPVTSCRRVCKTSAEEWSLSNTVHFHHHAPLRATKVHKTIPHHVQFPEYYISWSSQNRRNHSLSTFPGRHTGKLHFWVLFSILWRLPPGIWGWRIHVITKTWIYIESAHVRISPLKQSTWAFCQRSFTKQWLQKGDKFQLFPWNDLVMTNLFFFFFL